VAARLVASDAADAETGGEAETAAS
jgi:hypothetical protein